VGDVLADEAQSVVDGLNRGVGAHRAVYEHLDVTSARDWDGAVAIAEQQFGALNVLLNNAGVLSMLGVEDETEDGWQRVVDVSQKGRVAGVRAAAPALAEGGRRRDREHLVAVRPHRLRGGDRLSGLQGARCASSPRRRPSNAPRRTSA